jgi:ribosomal protein L37AE/L43A
VIYLMIVRDGCLLCPYCGSAETAAHEERAEDTVYECDGCERTFAAPS